jgi:ribosomal protein L10
MICTYIYTISEISMSVVIHYGTLQNVTLHHVRFKTIHYTMVHYKMVRNKMVQCYKTVKLHKGI